MLIRCAECGHDVSTDAKACPHCGSPNFLPPPSVTIPVEYVFQNPETIDDSVFYDGDAVHYNYRSQFPDRIEERKGSSARLYGGAVSVNNQGVGRLHSDYGWNPVKSGQGSFSFTPSKEHSICVSVHATSFDSQYRDDPHGVFLDNPTSITCIKSASQETEVPSSLSKLRIIVKIIPTNETRSVPRYKLKGLLKDKPKQISTETIPIYQYEISNIEIY